MSHDLQYEMNLFILSMSISPTDSEALAIPMCKFMTCLAISCEMIS